MQCEKMRNVGNFRRKRGLPASRAARLCYATSGHNCKLCIYSTKVHSNFGYIYHLLWLLQVWPANYLLKKCWTPLP